MATTCHPTTGLTHWLAAALAACGIMLAGCGGGAAAPHAAPPQSLPASTAIDSTPQVLQGHSGMAYRMYQAAFARAPDSQGLAFYVDALSSGRMSLATMAEGFFNSPEFRSRYGSGVGSADFVNLLYQNVLGRAPDAAGLQFHKGNLDAARLSFPQTLVAFSESPENIARVLSAVTSAELAPAATSVKFGMRGFNLAAFDASYWSNAADNATALDWMKTHGANTVALDWMVEFADDGTMVAGGGRPHPPWADIRAVVEAAKARGLLVILKPHVISTTCCGQNRNHTNTDANAFLPSNFFPAWTGYLKEMAAQLPMQSVDALAIGTELDFLDWQHRGYWEALIRDVRAVYPGRLTYDAMFSQWRQPRDIEDVVFWDLLDFISCSLYVRLTPDDNASAVRLAELMRSNPGVEITDAIGYLQSIAARYGKPVYALEGGYQSANGALWDTNAYFGPTSVTNEDLQARALDAYLYALNTAQGNWLMGVSLWDVQPRHVRPDTWADPNYRNGWGMYRKKAATTIAKWFSIP